MTSADDSRSADSLNLPEFAYYYPDTYWREQAASSFIKTILLFFDGIATLVPQHAQERAIDADPTLVGPLIDSGKMRMLEPREIIDASSVELMVAALTDWIDNKSMHDLRGTITGNRCHTPVLDHTLHPSCSRKRWNCCTSVDWPDLGTRSACA